MGSVDTIWIFLEKEAFIVFYKGFRFWPLCQGKCLAVNEKKTRDLGKAGAQDKETGNGKG